MTEIEPILDVIEGRFVAQIGEEIYPAEVSDDPNVVGTIIVRDDQGQIGKVIFEAAIS